MRNMSLCALLNSPAGDIMGGHETIITFDINSTRFVYTVACVTKGTKEVLFYEPAREM